VGETAPAVLDNAPSNSINWNPFKGPQDSLPAFVYRFILSFVKAENHRAWTGAMVLLILVLILFALARLVGRERSPGRGRRWVPRRRRSSS
jgi:phosphate transport system permease protein